MLGFPNIWQGCILVATLNGLSIPPWLPLRVNFHRPSRDPRTKPRPSNDSFLIRNQTFRQPTRSVALGRPPPMALGPPLAP